MDNPPIYFRRGVMPQPSNNTQPNNNLMAPPTADELAQSKLMAPPTDTELDSAQQKQPPTNDAEQNASDALSTQKQMMKEHPWLAGLYGIAAVNPAMDAVGVQKGVDYAKAHPAETGALIASTLVPPEALVGPALEGAGALAKTLNIGQKAAAAYGIANAGGTAGALISGSPILDSLKQGNKQGSIYGAFSGLGDAAGAVAGPALQSFGETQAFKAAGAMLKDFRAAYAKSPDKINELGRTMLDEGLVAPGDSVSSIATKAEALKRQTGQQIGKIYDKVLDTMTDPAVQMDPETRLQIQASGFHPQAQADEMKALIFNKYKGTPGGTGAINKANQVIDEMAVNGNQIAPDHAIELKGQIDSMINWGKKSQDLPLEQDALKDVRNYIQNKLNDQVSLIDGVLQTPQSAELVRLNKLYGNVSTISNIARDYTARASAHSAMGMTGGLMAAGGMAAGAHGGLTEGGIAAGAMWGATKAAQKYGNSVMATGADNLGSFLQSGAQSTAIPYQIGRISDPDNQNYVQAPQNQQTPTFMGPSTTIIPTHKLKGR